MLVWKAIPLVLMAFSQQPENVVELSEEELEIVDNIEFFMIYESIENESSDNIVVTPTALENSQGSNK